MPPSKWDDEEESTSPPPPVIPRRSKFDDEEEEEVLDSWDAAEDSDVEREKEAKAAEAKAKAEAEAAANKKSKAQRIDEHKEMRRRQAEEEESDESDEDEAEKRARLLRTEKESDLAHAADLFGENGGMDQKPAAKGPAKAGGSKAKGGSDHDAIENVDMDRMKNRSAAPKTVVVSDSADPTNAVDLAAMALFKPTTKDQFTKLTTTLAPLLSAHSKKPHYSSWAQEFTKQLVKELPSGEIKKIASALTTASNEKMREERAADKGTKKSKAAKTKVSLAASRDDRFDSANYGGDDDGLGDDDFM